MKLTQRNTLILIAAIVFLLIICVAMIVVFTSSDRLSLPLQAEPDPCSSENIAEQARHVGEMVHHFEDIKFVAIHTNKEQLVAPILQMQEIRYDVVDLELPYCMDNLEKASINYMNSVIIYMTHHMAGMDSESVRFEFLTSEELLNIYKEEYALATGMEYLQPTSMPTPSE